MVIHDLRNPTVSIKIGLENTKDLLHQIRMLKGHSQEFTAMQQKLIKKLNLDPDDFSNCGNLSNSHEMNN